MHIAVRSSEVLLKVKEEAETQSSLSGSAVVSEGSRTLYLLSYSTTWWLNSQLLPATKHSCAAYSFLIYGLRSGPGVETTPPHLKPELCFPI